MRQPGRGCGTPVGIATPIKVIVLGVYRDRIRVACRKRIEIERTRQSRARRIELSSQFVGDDDVVGVNARRVGDVPAEFLAIFIVRGPGRTRERDGRRTRIVIFEPDSLN